MRKIVIGAIILIVIGVGAFLLKPDSAKAPSEMNIPSETSITESQSTNITASFSIVTDSIVRSFTNAKYHNQSADVFIIATDPTQVHVVKTGVKWSDFFATLPMKVSKDCLITGDGEALCNGQQGTLKFYLNDKEDKDLLDREIKQGDKILIQFTSS